MKRFYHCNYIIPFLLLSLFIADTCTSGSKNIVRSIAVDIKKLGIQLKFQGVDELVVKNVLTCIEEETDTYFMEPQECSAILKSIELIAPELSHSLCDGGFNTARRKKFFFSKDIDSETARNSITAAKITADTKKGLDFDSIWTSSSFNCENIAKIISVILHDDNEEVHSIVRELGDVIPVSNTEAQVVLSTHLSHKLFGDIHCQNCNYSHKNEDIIFKFEEEKFDNLFIPQRSEKESKYKFVYLL